MTDIIEFNKDLYIFHPNKENKNDLDTDLFYIKSKDEGVNWSSKQKITEFGSSVNYVTADAFQTNIIHVLYREYAEDSSPNPSYYLTYAKGYLNDETLEWATQRLTLDPNLDKRHIDTAMSPDKCHYVYQDFQDVYYSYFDNTTEDATIVQEDRVLIKESAVHPRIILDDDGNIYVFYIDLQNLNIMYVRFNAAFNSWSQPFLVVEAVDAVDALNISIAVDYSDITNSINLLYNKDNVVYHTRSISNKKWTAPIVVFSDVTYTYSPEIVIDCDGNVNALVGAKSSTSPSAGDKVFYRYSTDGIVWGTTATISRYTPWESTNLASDIKPSATTDFKGALNVTYSENHIEYNETQSDQIYFKIVDGVFSPFVNPVIPLVSIPPVFLAKAKQRNFTQANIITDVNDKMFLYEYDSLFREVTVKTSEDYGNTWTKESTAFTVDDTIKDLTIKTNGYETVAIYKKYDTGSWGVFGRVLEQGDIEWSNEVQIVATTNIMKEKSIDFVIQDQTIYVVTVSFTGSPLQYKINLHVLDLDLVLINSPATVSIATINSTFNTLVDVSLAIDWYISNSSPTDLMLVIPYCETYKIGSPELLRKRIKVATYNTNTLSTAQTVIDDDWVNNEVPSTANLTSLSVSTNKEQLDTIAHICYTKTVWPAETYIGREKFEQITYWVAFQPGVGYYQPIEIIKSSKPINLEQTYFNETRCIAKQDPDVNHLYVMTSGKHVSTLGTNYASWFARAEIDTVNSTRKLSNKKLVSYTTFIDDYNNECIALCQDSQDSIHFVTDQYSEVSYGTTVYSKTIEADLPLFEYQTVLPTLIEPVEEETPP